MKTLLSFAMISLLISGYIFQQQDKHPEILEKGAEISGKLVKAIMGKLNAEIQKSGLAGAVEYCSLEAIPITDSIAKMEQVAISRVSHKYRNPLNAANEREIERIERYISQHQKGEQLIAQLVSEDRALIYYSPIVLGSPMCLSCHGETDKIDIGVREVLNEKYPEDKAVNFKFNEIRGMFKIVFEKEIQ